MGKYRKDYQKFAKQITDEFISKVSGDCLPKTWSGHSFCDDMYKEATNEEEDNFYRENNKWALKWLNENMITYDEWQKNENII